MKERAYTESMLIMGVLSSIGFPDSLKKELEIKFGSLFSISSTIPFTFTDYYNEEMGVPIERFFLSFSSLVIPDTLADIKTFTNELEHSYEVDGKRKINLDPGLLSESSIILATTKNRSHRIPIGRNLYGEVTLIYQNHGFVSFPWTYADYRSKEVQDILISMRHGYLAKRREQRV